MNLNKQNFMYTNISLVREGIDCMYKSMEQIEQEYNGQWVFMINCTKDKYHSVVGGEVLFSDKSMNAVLRTMKSTKTNGNSTYVRYIGNLPEGVAVIL